ncbi:hypothetical protein SAMN05421493_11237 [Pseudobutyrivibrio sp. 49]|uniref:hypothetical protein n=1 Tax=unclassified Pseudobutyrivibrio TaxID=2638619 RepID=UPI00088A3E68|nr:MULTISPECIES: hypothetical protein [unclassified Pseudobutyrivibrio]SDI35410.1 hypothetical protein SAMN05421493_11237 [Pseudobutyrivibrio sp. 49]SFN94251.1 hypothetical protein SAMN04487831_105100 [Pseudobutyrivibrio sp. UC1225]
MKFNTIFLCCTVWAVAGVLAIVFALMGSLKEKRKHSVKMIYLRQFILMAQSGKTSGEIIKELYYFFVGNEPMRKIMLRAMNMPNVKGLDYINRKIGCDPMKILHGFLIKREAQNRSRPLPSIPDDIIQYFIDLTDQWEEDYQETLRLRRQRKIRGTLEICAFMLVNYHLYSWLRTDLSLWIFAIVNTLGVVFFIILENEKTQSPSRGIQGLYHLASGMGLIINIFTVVSGWLGQVA